MTVRHKAVRYAVPVAVAGAAAAAIGFVPAFAGDDPELPDLTAQQLVAKILESDTRALSGTVRVTSDLGLPELPNGVSLGGRSGRQASPADPRARLTELASGRHTLRVAVDGAHRQRVSIVDDAAEYNVIRNADDLWAYDSRSNSAFHADVPRDPALPESQAAAPQLSGNQERQAAPELPDARDLTGTQDSRNAGELPDAQERAATAQDDPSAHDPFGMPGRAADPGDTSAQERAAQDDPSASDASPQEPQERAATAQDDSSRHDPFGMPGAAADPMGASPQELAAQALAAMADTTSVTVDGTAKVAGRDAYNLLIQPEQAGTTVDAVRIAVDAEEGVPLTFTVTPKGGGRAALDVRFTSVEFARPPARTFEFTPPAGAEVTEQSELADRRDADARRPGTLPGSGRPDAERPDAERPGAAEPETDRHGETMPEASADASAPPSRPDGTPSGMRLIGRGWTTVVELEAPDEAGVRRGEERLPSEARTMMRGYGEEVTGDFGTGTLFSTRLVNVLMTEDGAVYAGAVDKGLLVRAANAAK